MFLDNGFYKWDDYIDQAYMDLCDTDKEKCCDYPIEYLNDALIGIIKSELILIGADSGCGKTEIANQIAFHNAKKKKRVYLFSLEGDRYEVAQRERYRHFADVVISNKLGIDLDYRKFIMNEYAEIFKGRNLPDFNDEMLTIDEMMKAQYKTLKIFKRETGINKDMIKGYFDLIKNDADLIIIDHLHYFEFMTNNEYSEISEIMKVIKKKQDEIRVPVILVSHLRKKGKDRAFPDNEDFHGSSNIYKQANTCILFSNIIESEADYFDQVSKGIYKTGIRITKSRTGIPTRLIGISQFQNKTKTYAPGYEVAITYDHNISKLEADKYPKWAWRHRPMPDPKKTETYGGK